MASLGCHYAHLLALLFLPILVHLAAVAAPGPQPATGSRPGAPAVPLRFEPNLGQAGPGVSFLARAGHASLLLGPDELRVRTGEASTLCLQFAGARRASRLEGSNPTPGRAHYYFGTDPGAWLREVPLFRTVRAPDLYPGIDLVYYGGKFDEGGRLPLLEYDLVVHPGADPERVRIVLSGYEAAELRPNGDFEIRLGETGLRLRRPCCYQEIDGRRKVVEGAFRLAPASAGSPLTLAFQVGSYDRTRSLIIDPELGYSTYLGGSPGGNASGNDDGNGIAVDAAGRAHVVGRAESVNFPTRNAADATLNNGPASSQKRDAFVTKLTADGSDIEFSTYLGGSDLDVGFSISLDGAGNVYAAGRTASTNFPTTRGALRETDPDGTTTLDGILVKLSPTGALLYSTYVGGSNYDICHGIAAVDERDASGNFLGSHVLLTGETRSTDFPGRNGYQTAFGGGTIDGFILSLNPNPSDSTPGPTDPGDLLYGTYLGGRGDDSGYGLGVDADGRALVTGMTTSDAFPTTHDALKSTIAGASDAFVARVDPSQMGAGSLSYSSYLGGGGNEIGYGIARGSDGHVYAAGETTSANFPTSSTAFDRQLGGSSDAFVVRLDLSQPPLSQLRYGTLIGGSSTDWARQIAVDPEGTAFVAGGTNSSNFPQFAPLQGDQAGQDAWALRLNAGGTGLLFSTYLGGSGTDEARSIALDPTGNAYLTGETNSSNFPTTAGAFDRTFGSAGDCWITKIAFVDPPPSGEISFRSSAGGNNDGGSTGLTLPRPTGVAAGDLLLSSITVASTSVSLTPPAGWVQVINASEGTVIRTVVYRRVAGNSEPASYTWTFPSSIRALGAVLAYQGVDPTQPINAADGYGNAASTAITAPGITPSVPACLLVHVAATAVATTITPAPGMTERLEVPGTGLTVSVSDQPRPTAGYTGTRTATAGSAARNVGHCVALRPGASP